MSQINLKVTDYGTEAYKMALEWYYGNGPTPIPKLTEAQYAAQGLKDYSVLFQPETKNNTANQAIRFGEDKTLRYISIEMTPIIAAIKCGFSDNKILELIHHHNINIRHFKGMSADDSIPLFQDERNNNFYLQDIYISVVRALNCKPSGAKLLDDALESSNDDAELHIALLHTDKPKYWNNYRIQRMADCISLNDYLATPHYTVFDELSDCVSSQSCFPEKSAIEFLRRSGMLNNDLIRKRSANYGMWETTLKRLVIDRPMALQIFLACANATDLNEQAMIRRALKSMSMDSYDASISPSYAIERLKDVLDDCAVEDVTDSIVLKLNLMSLDRHQDFDGLDGGSGGYEEICYQNTDLICNLTKEIMCVPLHQMAYSHFGCLRRLPLLNLMPQRLVPGAPEALIIYMLKGFDQYTYQDNTTDEKKIVDDNARAGLKDLVQVLACHHDFDYSYFQDLSSTHKKDLIKMGLDVKKLPGLTLQDLGEAFSHDMGL